MFTVASHAGTVATVGVGAVPREHRATEILYGVFFLRIQYGDAGSRSRHRRRIETSRVRRFRVEDRKSVV